MSKCKYENECQKNCVYNLLLAFGNRIMNQQDCENCNVNKEEDEHD